MTFAIMMSFYVFILACFAGYQLISKVPGTLHTPLMSGANAISGVTILGAMITASYAFQFSTFLGFLAVILAAINVIGGFVVTDRMLKMFKKS